MMSLHDMILHELDITAIEIWQIRAHLELDLDEISTGSGTGEGHRDARLSG